ncbi:MAG: ABC transporter substrate-binding protein [Pseudomonadota bacterium]
MDENKPPPVSSIRRRLLAALCASPLVAAAGCERAVETPKPAGAPIRVGAYFWPGSYWVDIAHQKGWFREAGLEVEWVDTNADYFASFDALVEGKLDIIGFTLFDLVLYNARGKNLTGFLASDYSFGADTLVARPGIATIAALAGKKLGLSKGTYLEYIWTVVAPRGGLKPAAVRIVDLPGEKLHTALINGQVDAILAWEPYAGQALKAVQGAKLFDSSQIPGISWSVYAARSGFLQQRAADIQTLVRVWQRADRFLREQPDAAYAVVAEVNKKSVAEVREFARLDRVLDLRQNLSAFSYASGFDSLHGAARQINDFQIRAGLTDKQIDTSLVFDSRFLADLGRSDAKRCGALSPPPPREHPSQAAVAAARCEPDAARAALRAVRDELFRCVARSSRRPSRRSGRGHCRQAERVPGDRVARCQGAGAPRAQSRSR